MLYSSTLLALLPLVASQSCGTTDAGTDPCRCYFFPCMNTASGFGTPVSKTTTSGPITGRYSSSDGVERYVGIPVAATTAGAARWTAPAPLTWASTPTGRTDNDMTSEYPCPTWGYPTAGTENCLTVDLFTNQALTGQAIGIYIHGGGFSLQNPFFASFPTSIAYQAINAPALTNAGKSISAYVHYRLGALGWMAHPGFSVASTTLAGVTSTTTGATGNYGMMDGINAVKWISDNAATFGGDNTKMTMFGESAGAAYLSMFMASPFVTTLGVATIIIESPFITYTGGSLSQAARIEMGQLFTHRAGCLTSNTVVVGGATAANAATEAACLRTATSTMLVSLIVDTNFAGTAGGGIASSTTATTAFDAVYGTGGSGLFTYNTIHCWPVVDGFVMPVAPLTGWATLNAGTNVVIGHNSDEYATFCYAGFGSGAWICGPQFPDLANIAWVLAMYGTSTSMSYSAIYTAAFATFAGVSTPGTKMYALANGLFYNDITLNVGATSDQISVQMATDAWFGNLNTKMIETLYTNPSRAAGSVFHYIFAQETDPQYPPLGACHGCELTYVLGFYLLSQTFASALQPPSLNQLTQTRGAASIQVGTTMNTYWSAIFYTKSPNVAGTGLPTWTATTATSINTMIFQESISSTGAALNPCVRLIQCRTEPAANWRVARNHFWASAPTAETETPATCTGAAIGGYSHASATVTAANTCAAYQCADWCNVWTTGLAACASCPVNNVFSSNFYCSGWCNVYTCGAAHCQGCTVCDNLSAGTHCAGWCNSFTCWSQFCTGCTTCSTGR